MGLPTRRSVRLVESLRSAEAAADVRRAEEERGGVDVSSRPGDVANSDRIRFAEEIVDTRRTLEEHDEHTSDVSGTN